MSPVKNFFMTSETPKSIWDKEFVAGAGPSDSLTLAGWEPYKSKAVACLSVAE